MFCPECGTKNEDEAVFCAECGIKLPNNELQQEENSVCSICNEIIEDGDVFCAGCGTKIEQLTNQINMSQYVNSQDQMPAYSVDNVSSIDSPNEKQSKTKTRKIKKRTVVIITVAVLSVIIVGLIFLIPEKDDYVTGDIIRFGGYEWRVLDVQDNKALIITYKAIEKRAYHNELVEITWAGSDIRAYLNGDFYNSFDASDRKRIVETNIITNNNPWYGTGGGPGTRDYIFLLSIDEVVRYFGDSGQLNNRPSGTWYDEQNNAWYDIWMIDDEYNYARSVYDTRSVKWGWGLRSTGFSPEYAAFVSYEGIISLFGYYVNDNECGLRPAMWISLYH